MSSSSLFLPTLLASSSTYPICTPPPPTILQQELGLGLDEVVTGFISCCNLMHFTLQPGVRVQKYECQSFSARPAKLSLFSSLLFSLPPLPPLGNRVSLT